MLGIKHRASIYLANALPQSCVPKLPPFLNYFETKYDEAVKVDLQLGILEPQALELLELQVYATGTW